MSFLGLLTVAFVVLKLTHVIAWSWWLVTAPLWAPTALVFGVWALMVAVALSVGRSLPRLKLKRPGRRV